MAILRVHIIAPRNLVGRDGIINKTSDPYVVARVNDCACKTHSVPRNCNPIWNCTYDMKFHGNINDHLHIEVFSKNTLMDDEPIGFVDVPLAQIDQYNTVEKWFRLSGVKRGDIQLGLTCVEWFTQVVIPTQNSTVNLPPLAPGSTRTVTTTTTYRKVEPVQVFQVITTPPLLHQQQMYQQQLQQQNYVQVVPQQQNYIQVIPQQQQIQQPVVQISTAPPMPSNVAPPPMSYTRPYDQAPPNSYQQPPYQQQQVPSYPPQASYQQSYQQSSYQTTNLAPQKPPMSYSPYGQIQEPQQQYQSPYRNF